MENPARYEKCPGSHLEIDPDLVEQDQGLCICCGQVVGAFYQGDSWLSKDHHRSIVVVAAFQARVNRELPVPQHPRTLPTVWRGENA